MRTRPIRTLVVDDSALVRKLLTEQLACFPDIKVVGAAADPYVARDKILALAPDVITLDLQLPRMDGLTFLRLLMKRRPMPVIILSSLAGEGSELALEALQAGAVDVMPKPDGPFSVAEDAFRLAEKIRAAAVARIPRPVSPPSQPVGDRSAISHWPDHAGRISPIQGPAPVLSSLGSGHGSTPKSARAEHPLLPGTAGTGVDPRAIILMGASTGGTEALKTVLTGLRPDLPGICIVQHIPAHFSLAFANRLNELCPFEVREARAGDQLRPGLALVAPGGWHLLVHWRDDHYAVELSEGPKVHHQRPAVDVLFDSALKAGAAPHSLAVLLTGMGTDGAATMLRLRQAGAATVAQDEASCVVYGMPREAFRLGAVQEVLPLDQIAARVNRGVATGTGAR